MKLSMMLLTAGTIAALASCAQTNAKKTEAETQAMPSPKTVNKTHSAGQMMSQNMDYWVKKPGTPVYDSQQNVTRSLRLQPAVKSYQERDGWVRIDPAKDEWVKRSDLSDTPKDGAMTMPENSTGRAWIDPGVLTGAASVDPSSDHKP